MARIISLDRIHKDIHVNSSIVADYDMDDQFFSIWSYKQGDLDRTEGVKQNMQFDKEMARELRDALDQFLMER